MKFITKPTKIQSIIASVLTALALITLIMLSSLLSINNVSKLTLTFIYTISLVIILLIWHGVLQIKVFNDYKCKRTYLCADGILSLCMGALIIVSGILIACLQLDKIVNGVLIGTSDIRIFLTCFLAVIGFWKLNITVLSIKEKHFNYWCELLFTICWLSLSILCLLTMFIKSSWIVWVIISISWTLIILTIFYMLFSYVIKTPNYLETEEAIKQVNEELELEKAKKEQIKNRSQVKSTNNIENKLKKLKELRDQNLITEEEYTNKKLDLLDTF